jgi:repressor LexA
MAEELTTKQRRILEVIREAVNDRGYPPSIREICEKVGLTSTSSVHSQLLALEKKGYIRRDPTKPRAIEVYLEDPVASAPRPLPTYAPLLSGPIAAGTGVLPDERVEGMLPLPRELVGQGELFVLRVRGESMTEAGIFDDDYVVVRRQPNADNGDIVAAMLPNLEEEATVKRLSRTDGHVRLLPANPAFQPLDGDQASILGRVVAVLRRL